MDNYRKPKVFVLGDTLSSLAVARALGRKGIDVIAGIEDREAPLRYSKYVSRVIYMPSYASQPEGWRDLIKKTMQEERLDLVIPASESAFVPFCMDRDHFSGLAKAAVPDDFGFEATYFKDKTIALAKELGVPIPGSFVIRNKKDLERFVDAPSFSSPFVIKTVVSKIWKDGYKLEFSSARADSLGGVKNYTNDYLPFAPVLIQKWVSGIGVGQEFLCKNGEVLLVFQHHRIHEPQGSGGSSYRKSVPLDKRMLEHSKRILKYLKWTGVVMVEYRKNLKTGDFVLIEINGRFWGSLPLAIESGADFPYLLYKLLVEDERVIPANYKIGVYARDLMDDLRFVAKLYGFFAAFLSIGLAKVRFFLGLEKWDAFTWDDPRPGLMEFWFVINSIFSSIRNSLYKITFKIFYRLPRLAEAKRLLEINRSILFVCLGNVSRSPFAAEYLKKKLAEKNVSGFKVSSAGLYPQVGRRATPYIILAAVEYDIDLTRHLSSIFDKEKIDSIGLIFCMDLSNYKDVKKNFPSAEGKLFLLDSFDGSYREVFDPWGGNIEAYRDSCRTIKEGIDTLFSSKLIS